MKEQKIFPQALYKTPVFSGNSEGVFWCRQLRDQKFFQKHYTKRPRFLRIMRDLVRRISVLQKGDVPMVRIRSPTDPGAVSISTAF